MQKLDPNGSEWSFYYLNLNSSLVGALVVSVCLLRNQVRKRYIIKAERRKIESKTNIQNNRQTHNNNITTTPHNTTRQTTQQHNQQPNNQQQHTTQAIANMTTGPDKKTLDGLDREWIKIQLIK